MKITVKNNPELDLTFFTISAFLLKTESNRDKIPNYLKKAYDFMKVDPFTHGATTYTPFKGFRFFESGRISSDQNQGKPMFGITSVAKTLFHPLKLEMTSGGQSTGGSKRGICVDTQLSNLINNGDIPQDKVFNHYTILTLKALKNEGLRPFCCQYAASNNTLGIATSHDILCTDDEGRVINVQLKTGFETNYTSPCRTGMVMMSPHVDCEKLSEMPISYHNKHRIQLIMEHIILGSRIHNSKLLVVSSESQKFYNVDRNKDLIKGIVLNLKNRKETDELHVSIKAQILSSKIRKIMAANKRKGTYRPPFKFFSTKK
jgi:hypothetical protein